MSSFQDNIGQNIVNNVVGGIVDNVVGNVISDAVGDVIDPITNVIDNVTDFNNFVNNLTSNPLGVLGLDTAFNSLNDALGRLGASMFGGSGLRFPNNLMQESGGNYMIFESSGSNIALFLPRGVSFQYGMNWQEMDTFSALRLLLDEGPRLAEIYKRSSDMKSTLAAIGDTGATNAALGIGMNMAYNTLAGVDPKSAAYAGKLSGLAPNPLREQIFRGVNFRQFSFSFDFYPKSPSESNSIKEIIKTFKTKMHPEYKFDKYIYKYPDEFCITFYSGGNTTFMPKIKPCALTDMVIDYAPLGAFVSTSDGSPVKTSLRLMFKELGLLTKKDINEGY